MRRNVQIKELVIDQLEFVLAKVIDLRVRLVRGGVVPWTVMGGVFVCP